MWMDWYFDEKKEINHWRATVTDIRKTRFAFNSSQVSDLKTCSQVKRPSAMPRLITKFRELFQG